MAAYSCIICNILTQNVITFVLNCSRFLIIIVATYSQENCFTYMLQNAMTLGISQSGNDTQPRSLCSNHTRSSVRTFLVCMPCLYCLKRLIEGILSADTAYACAYELWFIMLEYGGQKTISERVQFSDYIFLCCGIV